MGRELAEGKAQAAEAAEALARAHADDMRAAYRELEDHCLVGLRAGGGGLDARAGFIPVSK